MRTFARAMRAHVLVLVAAVAGCSSGSDEPAADDAGPCIESCCPDPTLACEGGRHGWRCARPSDVFLVEDRTGGCVVVGDGGIEGYCCP